MKKFWKRTLGLLTLATVVPVSIDHNEATGKTTYQSLLASLEVGPSRDGIHTDVSLNVGEGMLSRLVNTKKEAKLYADDEPEAAVPFTTAEEAPEGGEPPVFTEV